MKSKKEKLASAVGLLKQLSHPVRLSLLCNLLHSGEMSVSALVEAEGGAASQSHISQFLAKMRDDDMVKCRKEGQTVYYQIKSPQVKKMIQALTDIYCKK